MQCPVCTQTQLLMSERQGIEIDYCPQCRGVWLDRGELDKLIERSTSSTDMTKDFGRPSSTPYQRDSHGHSQEQRHGYDKDDYHRRKKKGFLGELFDFD